MDETQDMLLESAGRLFGDHCDTGLHQQIAAGTWPSAVWRLLEDMGLPRALAPESLEGAGLSFGDLAPVIRLIGEYAVPLPLVETMLANWMLGAAGIESPSGPLSVAPVRPTDLLEMHLDGGSWRLSGTAHRIPWGRHVDHVVVIASSAHGTQLALVETADLNIEHSLNLAGEPRDTLHFVRQPVSRTAPSALSVEQLHSIGAALRALQIAGACARALALTGEYANLRIQFGKPLSKLQVIQQYIAVQATQTAAAFAAANLGTTALDNGFDEVGIACAKARSGEAAGVVASIAHQVFGAIGFAKEHMLHLSTQRLWSWRDEFGAESHWNALLGKRVFAAGGKSLWPTLAPGLLTEQS